MHWSAFESIKPSSSVKRETRKKKYPFLYDSPVKYCKTSKMLQTCWETSVVKTTVLYYWQCSLRLLSSNNFFWCKIFDHFSSYSVTADLYSGFDLTF